MRLSASQKSRFDSVRDMLALSPITLSALTIVFVFIFQNYTFWTIAAEIFSGHPLSWAGYIAALFCLTLAAFSLFAFPWVVKPFLASIVLLGAVTSFYMDSLGVMIDRDMIQNVMVTTLTESRHLVTAGFLLHVLVFGILPALVILSVRIRRQRFLWAAGAPVVTFVVSLALAGGFLMVDLKAYASTLRERKEFMGSFQPGAPLVGAIRYAKMMSRSASLTVAPVGRDAVKGASYAVADKPVLAIVVAGETARSQNFSLNGYTVDTNPELAKLPVVSFSDVDSCGTATAVSLPCMFSKFDRADFSYEDGVANENVLDVLTTAGMNVEWWDNNTGHKGIADRIQSRSFTHETNPEFCAAGECTDGIFMQALQEYVGTITRDTVLVLHQIGSHGPTYYLRYPDAFERFTPACRTAEFKNCSPEEIRNSYDNTILFTDKVLADTIAFLTAQDGLVTSLLYISDHGESLGENGLFLHGSPYFMAPEFQTKVPMILWMSDTFQDRFSIDDGCLETSKDAPLSQDNLFHSLLGMLDIRTSEYNRELDIFASCKTAHDLALK